MISAKEYQQRVLSIASKMKPNSIMILIAPQAKTRNHDVEYPYRNSSNLLYITGLNLQPQAIIIQSDKVGSKNCELFLREKDPFFERWMGKILSKDEVTSINGIKAKHIHSYEKLWSKLEKIIKNKNYCYYDFGLNKVNDEKIFSILYSSIQNARAAQLVPETIIRASSIIHEQRLFKSNNEIKVMQLAGDISARAHNQLIKFSHNLSQKAIGQGKSKIAENSLRTFIESSFFKSGSDSLAYPSIVAGGNNANILHYIECNEMIKTNELVLVDAGCELKGYSADITRTFSVGGKFSSVQKDCYEAVLDAQKKAIGFIEHGKSIFDIHEFTIKNLTKNFADIGLFKKIPDINDKNKIYKNPSIDEIIKKKLYAHYYMHGTSHFLGLDVHDAGKYYIDKKPRPLKQGMVFTVEPGLYISQDYDFVPKEFRGLGIRIEDNILMTKKGTSNLTIKAKKEIKDIEA